MEKLEEASKMELMKVKDLIDTIMRDNRDEVVPSTSFCTWKDVLNDDIKKLRDAINTGVKPHFTFNLLKLKTMYTLLDEGHNCRTCPGYHTACPCYTPCDEEKPNQ
jgi:hypothetical protein